jgi:hypothetical protein
MTTTVSTHASTTSGSPAESRVRSPLPFERAFVVQLRADADVGGGAVSGRVEHLSSGVAASFDSVEELVAWICDAALRIALGTPGDGVVLRDK